MNNSRKRRIDETALMEDIERDMVNLGLNTNTMAVNNFRRRRLGDTESNTNGRPLSSSSSLTTINNDNIKDLVNKFYKRQELPPDLQNVAIGDWDVSGVTDMAFLFSNFRDFNEPLNNWNVSNVTNMLCMFDGCRIFNQPLNDWANSTSNVTNMAGMFTQCSNFNQPLNNWNVSNVTNMYGMFSSCRNFNQPLNKWNVSNVTDVTNMFSNCIDFNQPLNNWANYISNVTEMYGMFYGCTNFDQPLNEWNVSNVTNMAHMFDKCRIFNQPLNDWNVSNVTIMAGMFSECENFNQPLNDWNVSNVMIMRDMFFGCRNFNQPLNNWNVSNVTDMERMFSGCRNFNQPLNNWIIINDANVRGMFKGSGISPENRPPAILPLADFLGPEELYASLQPTVLDSQTTIISNDDTGHDFISGDDLNIRDYLKDDPQNVVFKQNKGKFYLSNKGVLLRNVAHDKSNIVYGCRAVDTAIIPRTSNIIRENPYANMKTVGLYGLINLSDLKTIIEDNTIRAVELTPTINLETTSSLQMLLPDANALSASHCAKGQGATVYSVSKIELTNTTGGRKTNKKRHTLRRNKRNSSHKKKSKRAFTVRRINKQKRKK